ncbi:MerR family transcriptional regulator [Sediminibacillus massiliensis]|uniref:MerR family transcriptional regulator n=1 Tax=Sediminibacillus massiliensis TaxID=1926277 RepID=UPI00098882E7|nr:MerR family transcriptional regulator [Sediminibacillus massiliensis]
MTSESKYSIGEFSERTGISIRTLHYYDEIGLLQPEKNQSSGHRVYVQQDLLTLQKILSLKFLGYSLEKIRELMKESSFTVDLNETLGLHLKALEKESARIDASMEAIRRVMRLLEEERAIDSNLLLSLINHLHLDNKQKEWMEEHMLTDVAKELANKSEQEKTEFDDTFLMLAKRVRMLYGRPFDDPEVIEMAGQYLEATFAFLGEDLIRQLADAEVEETDIKELEQMMPSPFTEEEQEWLNQAMEFFTQQAE